MDKKIIGEKSKIKVLKNPDEEIRLNYTIDVYKNNLSISGKIINSHTHLPVKNACIKITDKDFAPLCHCFSNQDGYFCFYAHFCDLIRIIVSKNGFITYSSSPYNIENPQLKNLSILLTPHCKMDSIATGIVLDYTKEPVENVYVTLKKEGKDIDYATYTNKEGFFILEGLSHGLYTIMLYSHMYNPYSDQVIFEQGNILSLGHIYLKKKNLKGTLNGLITDIYGFPIHNALVVLFNAYNDTPIAFTKTNEHGVYLFYNLNMGSYYIVAKKCK